MSQAARDENSVTSTLLVGSTGETFPWEGDETTGRAYVDVAGGSGSVTSVSVVTANGFAGSVADPTTTPAITLSTTANGILQGNGTAISAITVGSGLDFTGGTLSATGGSSGITVGTTTITSGTNTRILYNNAGVVGEYTLTGSGTVVAMATAPTFVTSITTPSVLATANDSGALGASGTAFSDLFLASGGVINWNAGNATITHSAGLLTVNVPVTSSGLMTATGFEPTATTATGNRMYLPAANTIGISTNGTGRVQFNGTAMSPITNDGFAIGSTTLQWSDLFLASGAVLNFANGNSVVTHSSAVLTVSTGDLRVTTAGTNAASVVTNAGTQTITNKRNQPRTASSTSNANLDPDLSSANVYFRTTQTTGLTIGAPTGTPVIGEVIAIYVDSAGSQTLTINSTYKAFGTAFPASTTAGKTFMMVAQYNGTDWKTTWSNAV